jgi:hypothetical protein
MSDEGLRISDRWDGAIAFFFVIPAKAGISLFFVPLVERSEKALRSRLSPG